MALALAFAAAAPARAARPLLDSGKWDQYFALFARDTQVPWKKITVRLDTYSGAPVDFAAYSVDPYDVLVAGSSAKPRAIDTSRLRPVVRWRFTPPAGLRYQSNDVEVPLENREGFYVVEARRGDAAQQVWLNLSRIGVITKESPAGVVLYGADLGTGRALAGMRVTYLVGSSLVVGKTDAHGIARAPAPGRPRFALAEWGNSKAFVNFIPVAPVPPAIVGLRLERGVVRAGERIGVIGFVRKRAGAAMRPATGEVHVTVVARGRTIAGDMLKLDAAGAFASELTIPPGTAAGDVAVLATAAGATGGATLHVDAVGDAVLSVKAACGDACPPAADIALAIAAKRDGVALPGREVHVRIVRTPHIIAPGTPADATLWATTTIVDVATTTDAQGIAHITIPGPSDGLASTYAIDVASGAATATARIVTPTAKIALAVTPERAQIDPGEAATVDVRGFDATDGSAASGIDVHVQMLHGATVQDETVKLDAAGRASVTFHNLEPGTNLVTAAAQVGGDTAFDAAAVTVIPLSLTGGGSQSSTDVSIDIDHTRYHPGDRAGVTASLAGAVGQAFVSVEGTRLFGAQTDDVHDGKIATSVTVPEAVGDISVGVAFVRDGAMYYATRRLTVDGPGHPRLTALRADRATYAPGATATIAIDDGESHAGATIALRLGDGLPSRGAAFDSAPGILAAEGTTTQNPDSDDPAWHTWVTPARSTAGDIFGEDRPHTAPPGETAFAIAEPRTLVWNIERSDHGDVKIVLPAVPGKYVLSILKVTDDGDVGAATLPLVVQ